MVLRFLLLDHSYKGEQLENLEGHEKNVMLLLDSKAASERSFISCGTLCRHKYSENDLLRGNPQHFYAGGETTLNYASKLYGIPKSTLSNKLNKRVLMERKMRRAIILTKEEEDELTIWDFLYQKRT
nr:unnamed protein product [Callosobruchus analis]